MCVCVGARACFVCVLVCVCVLSRWNLRRLARLGAEVIEPGCCVPSGPVGARRVIGGELGFAGVAASA